MKKVIKRPRWTGDVVAELHVNGITQKRLAAKLGWTNVWLSAVLNGQARPAGAEEKVKNALAAILIGGE